MHDFFRLRVRPRPDHTDGPFTFTVHHERTTLHAPHTTTSHTTSYNMKRIRLIFNKSRSSSKISKPKAPTAERYDNEMGGGLLAARTATAPASKKLSKLKKRSTSSIHPNLRSMCNRNSSRSFSRTMSDSPLSIEEPLCAYLSLFDGAKKDLKDVQIHIDNLFSDNFVHMMDGDTPIDKPTFIQINKQMLQQGIVATLEDIYFVDEYNVEYTVHWYYNEYSSRVTHVSALVIDQKIVKLEPCLETRSAFANNMRFSSWKNDKENSNSSKGTNNSGRSNHSTRCSTTAAIEESQHTATTILPDNLDQDQEKKALAEKVANLERTHTQDVEKCVALQKEIDTLNSTMASMEVELLHKSQELSMAHKEDVVNEMKPACDGVNLKQDEKRTKTGNIHSDKQLKGRWFRGKGRRKKK